MFVKGQTIGDKYEIVEVLGSGGFGTVYLAIDKWLTKEVAIKVPHRQTEGFYKFLKEPRVQASLKHKNIVEVYTVDKIDSVFFIVMEYVNGEGLDKKIRRNKKLPIHTALLYLEQILDAVEYAHRKNIIHRDLRPSNILIDNNNIVKITDFGISTWLDNESYASTKIGTPPYMAPEQFDGKATFSSDVYSVGCIAYEMLSGKPPVFDPNPFKIKEYVLLRKVKPLHIQNRDVSKDLSDIIMKAIEPDINKRFKTAKEFKTKVLNFLNKTNNDETPTNNTKKKIRTFKEKEEIRKCWNCKKVLPPFVKVCPFCGAEL